MNNQKSTPLKKEDNVHSSVRQVEIRPDDEIDDVEVVPASDTDMNDNDDDDTTVEIFDAQRTKESDKVANISQGSSNYHL